MFISFFPPTSSWLVTFSGHKEFRFTIITGNDVFLSIYLFVLVFVLLVYQFPAHPENVCGIVASHSYLIGFMECVFVLSCHSYLQDFLPHVVFIFSLWFFNPDCLQFISVPVPLISFNRLKISDRD